jgi:NAD+ synthase (glutamine-hydrolysing)
MHIALAQLNYKLGDFSGNFEKIAETVQNFGHKTDLIVFSELSLSGYFPKDLILQPGFIQAQDQFLEKLQTLTRTIPAAIVVGFIDHNLGKGKPYHNSLCLLKNGERLYTYHKKLLPVYNIFDESRYFSPGEIPGIFEFTGKKIGFLICEDGWFDLKDFLYNADPVQKLIEQNLDLIICINGSPSNIGKQKERFKHFTAIAKKCNAPLLFTNQVGGHDDIIYDGASFVCSEQGAIAGMLPSFEERTGIVTLANKQITLSADFSPYQPLSREQLFYQQTILGLKDYVKKCGFQKVVIGVSGGIDSALTLALAVKALGSHNVIGLAMPSRYSPPSSLIDAVQLCKKLAVTLYEITIQKELDLIIDQFKNTYHEDPSPITEQNIQARIRGRLLMEFSNQTGALVLSTGNKSELSTGYTTLYGDMTGGFNLIGDLYKTEVYTLSRYINALFPDTIPQAILDKEPSAELAFNQKDSDSLPPYAILDPVLRLYLEGDLLPPEELQQCQSFQKTLTKDLVDHIHRLVDKAEFKRRQAPPIIRVQRRAFGHGRQFPIAASYNFYD